LSSLAVAAAVGSFDPRIPCETDPPTDLFRAQLVCELLNTCGVYYVRGHSRVKLSRFLVYFHRYLLCKTAVPIHVEFAILDVLDRLDELSAGAMTEKDREKLKAAAAASAASAAGAAGAPSVDQAAAAPISNIFDPVGTHFPRYESMEAVCAAIAALEAKPEVEVEADEEVEEEDDEEDRSAAKRSTAGDAAGAGAAAGSSGGVGNEEVAAAESSGVEEVARGRGGEEEEEEEDGMTDAKAARLLDSMRAAAEDEDFEKAFKSLMLVGS
jgi:hypothetical protein